MGLFGKKESAGETAAKLKADLDQMENAAKLLQAVIDEMIQVQPRTASRNETMADSWSGHSGDAYFRSGVSLEKAYRDVTEGMAAQIDLLVRYRSSLLAVDENGVNQSGLTETRN